MTPLGIIMIVSGILAGLIVGYVIFRFFPNLFSKDKKINKVIKDPNLLLEKLQSNGKIYDMGKGLDFKIGKDSETGKDVVIVEEKDVKRAKEIQKKIAGQTQTKEKEKKVKEVKKKTKKNTKKKKG